MPSKPKKYMCLALACCMCLSDDLYYPYSYLFYTAEYSEYSTSYSEYSTRSMSYVQFSMNYEHIARAFMTI